MGQLDGLVEAVSKLRAMGATTVSLRADESGVIVRAEFGHVAPTAKPTQATEMPGDGAEDDDDVLFHSSG